MSTGTEVPGSSTPTITAIVPTYNRARLLGRALRSVLAQTFQDWECLVIDDASTDETEEVVRAFYDRRIRYFRHGTNKGGSAARNTGIREARGDYLAFLDSDDEWFPEKLERQLAVFEACEDPRLGAVVCGRIVVDPLGQRTVPGPDLYGDVYRKIVTQGLGGLGTSGYLVRRTVREAAIWFDESFPACQDREFMAQVSRSFGVESIAEPLIRQHRGHGGDHLWSGLNAPRGLERLIVKYCEDLKRWPHDLARLHHSVGVKYLLAGDRRASRRHLIAACRYQPLEVSVYAWLIVSLAGRRAANWVRQLRLTDGQ